MAAAQQTERAMVAPDLRFFDPSGTRGNRRPGAPAYISAMARKRRAQRATARPSGPDL